MLPFWDAVVDSYSHPNINKSKEIKTYNRSVSLCSSNLHPTISICVSWWTTMSSIVSVPRLASKNTKTGTTSVLSQSWSTVMFNIRTHLNCQPILQRVQLKLNRHLALSSNQLSHCQLVHMYTMMSPTNNKTGSSTCQCITHSLTFTTLWRKEVVSTAHKQIKEWCIRIIVCKVVAVIIMETTMLT